jgi:hypothetical protein
MMISRDDARKAEWDCTQLILTFYRCLDEKRYDDLIEIFDENGAWVRLGVELVGKAQIRKAMDERDDWLTAHIVTNVCVDVIDDNHANTTQYITLYRHEGWTPPMGPAKVVLPLGILRHRDQLVRIGGIWKFKRKTSKAIMVDRTRVTHYDTPAAQQGQ